MTEDEARMKWCPKCGRGINKDGSWMFPCIASDCMMWRWDGDEKEYTFTKQWEDGWKYEPYRNEVTLQLNDRWARSSHSRKGHCGLGGKP